MLENSRKNTKQNLEKNIMKRILTIGFTKKSAEQFFYLLKRGGVKKLVDIRINNRSQLAGFAKGVDLEYFTKEITGIEYEYNADFAPTKELLSDWRNKKVDWEEYQIIYIGLLENRKVLSKYDIEVFDNACFLCSEDLPDKCHRRLLVEYFRKSNPDIQIVHLK